MTKTKKEKCSHCSKKQLFCFECSHCNKQFCMIHRMPERHDCVNDYVGRLLAGELSFMLLCK